MKTTPGMFATSTKLLPFDRSPKRTNRSIAVQALIRTVFSVQLPPARK
jgi:hypothetical protein